VFGRNAFRVVAGSDRSVHNEENNGLVAWMIQVEDQKYRAACFLMQNVSSTTSYRAGLEGSSTYSNTSSHI
jgi:hypothetical protein